MKIQVVLCLTLFISTVFAQKKGFEAGIFFGLNGIHIEGDNEVLYNSSNGTIWGTGGISAGLSVKRGFARNLYWSFDLRYIRKGSIYEFTNVQGVRDFESIKLDYAELPVLIGYKTNIGKRYLYIEMGAAVAKLLNSEKLVSDYSYGQDISLFNQFKDYDYSMIGALKISANRKEKTLFGLRVARSFLSIHEIYKLYNFDYGIDLSYYF
ncbi:MAG: PorT family protein [Bacteroidales bacterium]|nr:PorT family protein [Bacteroidales bacterium]